MINALAGPQWSARFIQAVFILLLVQALFAPSAAVGGSHLPAMDCTVTKYLGTSGADEAFLNRIVPNVGAHLGGVYVDRSRTPNRFYVFDSANNRILGYYGFRPANPGGTFPPADIVLGQPTGWDHATANVAGPYSLVEGAASPYTNPISGAAWFFQLMWE